MVVKYGFRQDRNKMIKKLFFMVVLALPSLAFCQTLAPRQPNHTLPQYSSLTAANSNAGAARTMLRMAAPSARGGYAPLWPPGGLRRDTVVPSLYMDGSAGTLVQIGQMADGSVQQTAIGAASGVAPLDGNKMMSFPVSGDSSSSPVSRITAPGDAVYPTTISRNVSDHFSDMTTLRDFGMRLAPLAGAHDITWLQANWASLTSATPVILPSGSHWPDNRYVPDSGAADKLHPSQLPIVTAFGSVTSRPGYNTPYGFGIPYYGDAVPSFTHDDANFTFARTDSHETSAGQFIPVAGVFAAYDTPYEGGATGGTNNQIALEVKSVTTERDKGTFGNFVTDFYSKGYNYYGEMDVDQWHHAVGHGTNWVWDNIQELYSAEPFYCDPKDKLLCFGEYMNEEDMYGVGPELPESAYDPTKHNRQMFWLTTNHNIHKGTFKSTDWAQNMLVPVHKTILIKNAADQKEYMFSGTPTGYTVNGSWTISGTVSGNTLTVTNVASGQKIVPASTLIWDQLMTDEVKITAQLSGDSGGNGTYTISAAHNPNGFTISKPRNFTASSDQSHARFSTTGSVEPRWTFSKGDTFVDGSTTWICQGGWDYDLGVVIAVGGSNDPTNGYIERIGTVMEEHNDYIYNAIIDMSKAQFDPSVPYKIFGRLQKDVYFDLTADGTSAGQNNHLLGYDGSQNALTYKVNGVPVLSVKDSGAIVSSAPAQMPVMTRAQIRAYPSPAKGMEIYDSDDDAPAIYTGAGWKLMTLSALPAN
ncbi:hypothetical protein AD951_06395 [Acetobacter malorum]|uniref:Uncharacterized protein n=1 Tax=Acetobacter malorum TaxID=178901 RepID=A0A149UNW2_9PROT|nr:hypothetical protein [Acetobacter malorum]KXV69493.1 hypothetical protein AD951_06395 [Acetobacter malorum]